MKEIFEAAAKAGARKLAIADSVGFIRPLSMRYLMSHVRDDLPEKTREEVELAVHCHNDFGLATANSLAAVEEGVAYIHTCIAGFGERAGVAPFEEVVTALELLYNIDTGVDLGKIYRLSQTAEKAFAMPIQLHQPIVGEGIFAHEVDQELEEMQATPSFLSNFPLKLLHAKLLFS
jgi:isopropylmalate/homocitrate/citramalate synthase